MRLTKMGGITGYQIGDKIFCSECATMSDFQVDSQTVLSIMASDAWFERPKQICVRCARVINETEIQDPEDIGDKLARIAFLKRFSD